MAANGVRPTTPKQEAAMNRKTLALIAAMTGAAVLAPLAANAGEHRHEREHEHRWGGAYMNDRKPYTEAQIKVLAEAYALRRIGSDAKVTVTPGKQGTYKVSVTDGKGNLLRETRLNEYGFPVMPRGDRH